MRFTEISCFVTVVSVVVSDFPSVLNSSHTAATELNFRQVVVVFYVILFRKTMAMAMLEVDRTKAFVAMIPSHILSREVLLAVPLVICLGPWCCRLNI